MKKKLYACGILGLMLICSAYVVLKKNNIAVPDQVAELSDEVLLDSVERATFQYFWQGAEPRSGMARERIHVDGIYPQHDEDVIATGGSGFGIMAILAAMHRGYITHEEGVKRLQQIVDFLQHADRFHGAWPHWLYPDGKVKPFSPKDDGGDIVETAYLVQGLLCARQYLMQGDEQDKRLAKQTDQLWKTVEWNWYQHGQQVLYWHWSPDYGWAMNFPIHGYNECLIAYILAASSPTHAIPASAYHHGWAEDGKIVSPSRHFGYELQLHHQGAAMGGPLFWAHYSYLGLNPHGLRDRYADYWKENVDQTMINYLWCVKNPLHYKGYGSDNWGLTASYSVEGYAAHAPGDKTDLGVISPTAAVSSIVYTPKESLQAIRYWLGDPQMKQKLWGPYGFYDAFSESANWYPQRYLAIDQGPQVVMIENYRSGLLWRLFMSCPEVQQGLKKLGFQFTAMK
ncbi:MAG: beta-glucosidase [Thermoflavifilum aggregans]|nr:beta-glucosidase [Thermoflavifilum aggregans]